MPEPYPRRRPRLMVTPDPALIARLRDYGESIGQHNLSRLLDWSIRQALSQLVRGTPGRITRRTHPEPANAPSTPPTDGLATTLDATAPGRGESGDGAYPPPPATRGDEEGEGAHT